jgi:hypothetical protein
MFLDGFIALLLAVVALALVVFGTCAMIVGERKIVMLTGFVCLVAACAVGTGSMTYFVEFYQTALGR